MLTIANRSIELRCGQPANYAAVIEPPQGRKSAAGGMSNWSALRIAGLAQIGPRSTSVSFAFWAFQNGMDANG
jgi:hypothetical protein